MSLSIEGKFRVEVVNPDGSVHGDTGWRKNVVTQLGITSILYQMMGASASIVDTAAGWMAGNGGSILYIALGTGGSNGTGGETGLPRYASSDLTEINQTTHPSYARKMIGSSPVPKAIITVSNSGSPAVRTVASTVVMTCSFLAGFIASGTVNINEIGLYDEAYGGGELLAGSYFTPIAVGVDQQVNCSYTISLVQAAGVAI